MRHLRALILLLLLLSLPAAAPAAAHELGQSYVFLRVYDDRIEVALEITVDDLNRALELDMRPVRHSAQETLRPYLDAILAYVEPRFYIGTPAQEFALAFAEYHVRRIEGTDYVQLYFETDAMEEVPDLLDVEFTVLFEVDSNHRNLLVIEHNWKTATFNNESSVSLIFSPINRRQTLDLSSSSVLRGFVGLVQLGVWHIWIGLDHILFLLALVLPAVLYRKDAQWAPVGSFRPALINIVAIVSFFTIAHSITLSLAALGILRLPSRLVESIIAASIAVAALHNLYPRLHVREWTIAFAFGLFHGLGFAGVLSEIGLGQEYLVLSLLGFNLGVEIGQVVIICAVFPLLYVLRTKRLYMPLLKYGSMLLILIATFWFVERIFDISLFRYIRRTLRFAFRRIAGGL